MTRSLIMGLAGLMGCVIVGFIVMSFWPADIPSTKQLPADTNEQNHQTKPVLPATELKPATVRPDQQSSVATTPNAQNGGPADTKQPASPVSSTKEVIASQDPTKQSTSTKPADETKEPSVKSATNRLGQNQSLVLAHAQHLATAITPPPKKERRQIEPDALLPTDSLGRLLLDWDILASTKLDANSRPSFLACLKEFDGKPVLLDGYQSPLDDVGQMTEFMLLELPLGCYFCTIPEPNGIVLISMKPGLREPFSLDPVRYQGTLKLNQTNPDDFLFAIVDAKPAIFD